ncbi:cupin domain-containing protein [Halotia branconii]|uniref:Cupin domain-containing protein n=1 Tax=Halotia branconii CENA392 TaxID=1539056 RepID=A0AAJ6NPV7_9CYAN|nr:cupin domain-containing protein [Halotia branconii]WGV24490.1 cupin domain-containing protein [Halotia branconii CENA392]
MTSVQLHSNLTHASLTPEQIENPVTGDRMTILCSTDEYVKFQFELPPGSQGSPLHYHDTITETFEVLSGSLEMQFGHSGNIKVLRPGEILQVPPGLQHSFRNASHDWVTFISVVRPAGDFEHFLRSLYGLAIDGRVNHEGTPTNLLQFALLIEKADTIVVGPPVFLQKLMIKFLATVARFLRVEQSLAKYK